MGETGIALGEELVAIEEEIFEKIERENIEAARAEAELSPAAPPKKG